MVSVNIDHTTPSRPWVSGFRHHSGPREDGADSLHSLVLLHFTSHGQRSLGQCAVGFNSCFGKQEPWGKTFTLLRPVTSPIVLRLSESCRGKIWSDTVFVCIAETPFSSTKCLVLCSLVRELCTRYHHFGTFLPLVPVSCISPLSPRSSSFLVHEPPGNFLFPQVRTLWRCLCNGFI